MDGCVVARGYRMFSARYKRKKIMDREGKQQQAVRLCSLFVATVIAVLAVTSAESNLGCSTACSNCTEAKECVACIPGRYGPSCNIQCSGCKGGKCNRTSGVCLNGCEDGWFKYPTGTYCHACPIACDTCVNTANCSSCKDGYFGPTCENNCNVCRDNMCGKLGCLKGCVDGYYQASQQDYVEPPKEKYTKCFECPSKFCANCSSSADCDSCIPKFWGFECGMPCPRDCERCDKTTGVCLNNTCKEGEYRDDSGQCQSCPDTCDLCNSTTFCSKCKAGFSGSTCNVFDCHTLYNCQECDNEKAGEINICKRCLNGYFGGRCEARCSENCLKDDSDKSQPHCEITSGACTNGCGRGFWGPFCNMSCAVGCTDSSCDMLNGTCKCNNNYYGPYCNSTCSADCHDHWNGSRRCNETSGECLTEPPETQQQPLPQQAWHLKTRDKVGIIVGVLFAVIICVIIIIVRVYRYKKRRDRYDFDVQYCH